MQVIFRVRASMQIQIFYTSDQRNKIQIEIRVNYQIFVITKLRYNSTLYILILQLLVLSDNDSEFLYLRAQELNSIYRKRGWKSFNFLNGKKYIKRLT